MNTTTYIGNELELFQNARNWKSYFGKLITPYLQGNVLEVGAGIGGTTLSLCNGRQKSWLCLEPDPELAIHVNNLIKKGLLPDYCRVETNILQNIAQKELFDAILYIDVIEHIEKDKNELELSLNHLSPGGKLIILVPAWPFLYSEFDAAIGHFRRYTRNSLKAIIPPGLEPLKLKYLDSLGMMTSLMNKYFLRQKYPTLKQVIFWDTYLVPLSKIADPVFFHTFGKSLIGIWSKR